MITIPNLLKFLVGPLWFCLMGEIRELFENNDTIQIRANLDYFNQFLHCDIDAERIRVYTVEEAIEIIWDEFVASEQFNLQLSLLKEYVPQLTVEQFKEGCIRWYREKPDPQGVFKQRRNYFRNAIIYNSDLALTQPYEFYFDYLMLPIEVNARNQQKKEIWAKFERLHKQMQQVQMYIDGVNTQYIHSYISRLNLSENEIEQFINRINGSILMYNPGFSQQLEAELVENDAFILAEERNRELREAVTVPANPANPANRPSGVLKFGWGNWAALLLVLLLSLLKYWCDKYNPSFVSNSIEKDKYTKNENSPVFKSCQNKSNKRF